MGGSAPAGPAVRTTCPYCGVGCGILVASDGAGGWQVQGDPRHPANFGRLCSKGTALGETLGLEDRLLYPMIGDRRASWDEALDRVAGGFRRAIRDHGPQSIAFYLSGQLLTEDYYVANKLMKGFLGSANVDTNSRLCMASAVAGHKRAFGADAVPGCYDDLDEADLLVLVGSNTAWCHPVLFQRMLAARDLRGTRIIVIDPRRTQTAEAADLHLPLQGGTDTVLFNALLVFLADHGAVDHAFVANHTRGFDEALAAARRAAPSLAEVAGRTGLDTDQLAAFFGLFAATDRTVTGFSQGVNQAVDGSDRVNAIINCHLATGRIGRRGMGPFSLTGQPNAMGGREVGGLANQLAAHMGFEPEALDRVRRFWSAPRLATSEGLKAVDLFRAVEAGQIRALWVMATNPVVSLPRADAFRDALGRLDLFVVSDNVRSADTIDHAHVRLPACGWGEKDGTVTNSERRISRQRAFLPAPGEARPDWWIVCQVARRLGFGDAFTYCSAAEIFAEHAALSAFENAGRRDFDIGGLSAAAYDALEPVQWPYPANAVQERKRLFADGQFFTDDGRARFVAVAAGSLPTADPAFPFRLNTGRVRDQWHTMTRTGRSPRLAGHCPEPFVEVHPADAAARGLMDGGWAKVSSRFGAAVLRVVVTEGQQPGTLFVPIHWSDATAHLARIGALVHPETDPVSGQPDSKATAAAVAPVTYRYRGFVISGERLTPTADWWVRVRLANGWLHLVALDRMPEPWWRAWVAAVVPEATEGDMVELSDHYTNAYRMAWIREGRLAGCACMTGAGPLPPWEWLGRLRGGAPLDEVTRRALLAGRAPVGRSDCGSLVCACFGVGHARILEAIATGGLSSVEMIGEVLGAGTNCGSCLPELRNLLASALSRFQLSPIR
jgi:assimilatory nitrate reductase catalytic subunit